MYSGSADTSITSRLFLTVYADIISYLFVFAAIGRLLSLAFQWYTNSKKQEELEKQNILDELELLHSKINPSFLFSALDKINTFIDSDPDKASHYIILLSGIMRNLLYDNEFNKSSLEHELELIKDYIELSNVKKTLQIQ